MIIYNSPVRVEFDKKKIVVRTEEREIQPSIRTFWEIRDVLLNQNIFADKDAPIYYVFRHIYSRKDIRYDITYMPPKVIGEEYAKTYGHYHPKAADGYYYPEIYRVLKGKTKIILQKELKDGSYQVYIVNATKGDYVFIPPSFGHVSINPDEEEELIMENVVSDMFVSEYSRFKRMRGAAYYYCRDGIVQNTNYIVKSVEQLNTPEKVNRLLSYLEIYKDIRKNTGLLEILHTDPNKLMFLNKPGMLINTLKYQI